MHELGIAFHIADSVVRIAEENEAKHVRSVTLEVGEVSGIVPDYLSDFWLYARKKSELLKDAELKIETIKGVTYCQDCRKTYSTVQYAKICPYCGSGNTFLVTGNEYNIKEIEAM